MSKRNYTQYSNKKQKPDELNTEVETVEVMQLCTPDVIEVESEVTETVTEVAAPVVELVKETVETAALPETVEGVVVNCAKLNVRVAPNATADVLCVLDVKSEIEIVVSKSTDDWFYVCTAAGVEGYCMRKFVEAHL